MIYQMEELLPVVAALTEKYTSKESSSVTYEAAQMLMEAVMYCVKEWENISADTLWDQTKPSALTAYQAGYEYVLSKVHKAKDIYHRVMTHYEDYGCKNYRDTLKKGMPAFFLHYDARFQPQNHILTLDYPIAKGCEELCGIDKICRYLSGISIESELLECFSEEGIRRLLERTEENCGIDYMGNLCYLVLLCAIDCVIAEKEVFSLQFEKEDEEELRRYFQGDDQAKIERKIRLLLKLILDQCGLAHLHSYFQVLEKDFSVRIYHYME